MYSSALAEITQLLELLREGFSDLRLSDMRDNERLQSLLFMEIEEALASGMLLYFMRNITDFILA